jgi:hypothetical protein
MAENKKQDRRRKKQNIQSDIVDNDNFNGRASVNVRDGQYLTISRSSYTKQ